MRNVTISRLILHHVRIPLRHPFRISIGTIHECQRLVVEMHAGQYVGWGEIAVDAVPFYTWETIGTALHVGRDLIGPLLMSRSWNTAQEAADALDAYRGHSFAKAGFEAALWDILGQMNGLSVARMIGGTRNIIEIGPSIGIKDSPQATVRAVRTELEKGRRRIKIKVSPGFDDAFISEVRKEYPDISLMVDANSAYTPADIDRIAAWDRYRLLMIEQPFEMHDLYYHAQLCRRTQTPICLDESIENAHLADCAIRMQAADIVNIKVGRVGGLTHVRRIHDCCVAAGIPVWVGSRVGTGIGEAMRVAAAALPGATLPSDAVFCREYLADDILTDAFTIFNGCEIAVPRTPGMGIRIDDKRLSRYTEVQVRL